MRARGSKSDLHAAEPLPQDRYVVVLTGRSS